MQWDRRDLLIKNAALPSHSYEEMSQAERKELPSRRCSLDFCVLCRGDGVMGEEQTFISFPAELPLPSHMGSSSVLLSLGLRMDSLAG